jgi:hypothetical protein
MHSINYSDRSFVLFGEDTKTHKDLIKSLGGSWNRNLRNPITGERFGGWIFSNGRFNAVSNVLGNYIEPSDEYLPSAPELQQPYATSDEYLPSAPELQQPPSDEYISSAPVKSSDLISNMLFLCFVFMFCYIISQELQEI